MSEGTNSLPRIAWISPLPPQRSGVANYSYRLIQDLKSHFDIHLYHDNGPPAAELREEFDVYPLAEFANRHHHYDEAIYHLGNHVGFHRNIYELAWNFPGTTVLHDYNIAGFMNDAFNSQSSESLYKQALLEGYGDAGREELARLAEGRLPDEVKFPMSHAVVNRSRKVVVHHRWVKNQFINNEHIEVIPHRAQLDYRPTGEAIQSFKNRYGVKDDQLVVTCLGFINPNKLPKLQISVARRLIDEGYPLQMVFAGEPSPDLNELVSQTKSGRYDKNILFTGYLDERDYFSAILASDVIINLRNPSKGEGSLTLMQALAAAKPAIISDVNQYKEFPDKVCWKLAHDENEAQVLYAYLSRLLSDKHLRAAVSENCAAFVSGVLGGKRILERWRQIILAKSVTLP
jgi:glycosyltransferase involved in cell wall biosynthesis